MAILADLLLAVAAILAGGIAAIAWRNRPRHGTVTLSGLMLVIGLWSVLHLLEHQTTGQLQLAFERLKVVVLGPVPFLWLAFVLALTEYRDQLSRRALGALFIWPAVIGVLLLLPEGMFAPLDIWTQFDAEAGLIYWIHVGLSFVLLATGSVLLILHLSSAPGLFRKQALAVLAGLTAAWAGAIVSVFELFGSLHLHSLQGGIVIMGGFLLWAIVGPGLTKVSPIARRQILDTMEVGVVTVDQDDRVTTINPAAREYLGLDPDTAVTGRPLASVLDRHPDLIDMVESVRTEQRSTETTREIGARVLHCELSPIVSQRDQFIGGILLLSDVTEQRERRQEAERQRDRLEQFSRMVSHDLRNPLTVAKGRVELERDERESENLRTASRALDRIEVLIDDLRNLAKQGQMIEATEPVRLSSVADSCWAMTDSVDGDLEIESELTFQADPDRLNQLFENLFTNAITHGGSDVVVRVGAIDGRGFYVEDTGPGIPSEIRERVLEPGVTTSETGTGLGLAIVDEVVKAHGWELAVTESPEGGARFEILGPGADRNPA